MSPNKICSQIAAIGRFKPLHLGGAALLENMCQVADHAIIGVGSSNKYNLRNPFTATESAKMIDSYLSSRFDNYSILLVPDFGHLPGGRDGSLWKQYILENFTGTKCFVTGNLYVASLLEDQYRILHPTDIVPASRRRDVSGTKVRLAMASSDSSWQEMVPTEVANYLTKNHLVERFISEFGEQTLAKYHSSIYQMHSLEQTESLEAELKHTLEE